MYDLFIVYITTTHAEALGAPLTAVTQTTKHCSREVCRAKPERESTETVKDQILMNWNYSDT